MSRIENWQFCWQLALDLPLTGGGFDFNTRATFQKYAPQFLFKYKGRTWDTHNIYMAMLASHGFPGLLLFLAMIASCFISCAWMQHSVRQRRDLSWLASYCCIVQVSFLALLVNGMFVNMEYFDLVYDLVAVVAALKVICRRALSETADAEPDFDGHLVVAAAP
jgi:O-antigen ligase